MNKEQVAFVVILVLLGLFTVLGGEDDRRRIRRFGRPDAPEKADRSLPRPRFLDQDEKGRPEPTWLATGRNVYRAPRETSSLPPVSMVPPPLPRLPHPGLPLVPPVGGKAARGLRHRLIPDPSLEIEKDAGLSVKAPAAGNGGEEGSVDEDLTSVQLPEEDSLINRVTESHVERLRREEERRRRAEELAERRKKLDRVVWPNGVRDYGRIEEEQSDDDRFALKLKLDRLRADPSLSGREREERLKDIRLVFLQDNGPDEPPDRMVLRGDMVQAVEFADTPYNRFRLRKLQVDEDDLAEQLELADLVLGTGHLEEAAAHLRGMLERGLDAEPVFIRLADCLHRLFEYDAELDVLQQGLAAYGKSTELRARMGRLYRRLGVPELAASWFRKTLEARSAHGLANLGLGAVLLDQDRPWEALPHLGEAVTARDLPPGEKLRARLLRGRAHLLLGDLEAASREFRGVLSQDDGNAGALRGEASVLLASRRVDEAASLLERGVEAAPLDGGLRYQLGVCRFRQERWAEGRRNLGLAPTMDPLLTDEVRVAMAYLMEKAARPEEGLSEVERALEADPHNLHAVMQKGRLLFEVGDLSGARSAFERVILEGEERADMLVVLGDVAARLGDVSEAQRYYDRAGTLDPSFPYLPVRRLIGRVRQNRMEEAREIVSAFSSSESRDPVVQAALAFWHYESGNHQEALQRLRRLAGEEGAPDSLVTYAREQAARIEDNLSKEVWLDRFNRRGPDILRGWQVSSGYGVQVILKHPGEGGDATGDAEGSLLRGGRVVFSGQQKELSDGPTLLFQERPCRRLAAFGLDLDMQPRKGLYAGIGIMTFSRAGRVTDPWPGFVERRDGSSPRAGIQVALSPEGRLVYRVLERGEMSRWEPVPLTEYSGGPVNLELEVQDARKNLFALKVDNRTVLEGIQVPTLASSGLQAELQVFTQAVIGRTVELEADNVRIVTRKI